MPVARLSENLSSELSIDPCQGEDGGGVFDLAPLDHGKDLIKGEAMRRQELVLIQPAGAGPKPCSQIEVDLLIAIPGGNENLSDFFETIPPKPAFLFQLSSGTGERVFAGQEGPRRNLPDRPLNRRSPLVDQNDRLVFKKGHNGR